MNDFEEETPPSDMFRSAIFFSILSVTFIGTIALCGVYASIVKRQIYFERSILLLLITVALIAASRLKIFWKDEAPPSRDELGDSGRQSNE